MSRTTQQNKAMHKYYENLATALDDEGYSIQAVLAEAIDRPWTASSVKELIWKPLQLAMMGSESTTKIESDEVTKVYETINRHISTSFGVHVPFPSDEEIMRSQQ